MDLERVACGFHMAGISTVSEQVSSVITLNDSGIGFIVDSAGGMLDRSSVVEHALQKLEGGRTNEA